MERGVCVCVCICVQLCVSVKVKNFVDIKHQNSLVNSNELLIEISVGKSLNKITSKKILFPLTIYVILYSFFFAENLIAFDDGYETFMVPSDAEM